MYVGLQLNLFCPSRETQAPREELESQDMEQADSQDSEVDKMSHIQVC